MSRSKIARAYTEMLDWKKKRFIFFFKLSILHTLMDLNSTKGLYVITYLFSGCELNQQFHRLREQNLFEDREFKYLEDEIISWTALSVHRKCRRNMNNYTIT